MTNYDEEFPDMDPQVKADMEAEDAKEAEEARLESLKVDWKFFGNESEYWILMATMLGLIMAISLVNPANILDANTKILCVGMEWLYMSCLSVLYIIFF